MVTLVAAAQRAGSSDAPIAFAAPEAIFISYRRSDADGLARLLHLQLQQRFEDSALFFDRQSIAHGEGFADRIAQAMAAARAVLVLIGKTWLGELVERHRSGQADLVRLELALALRRLDAGDGLRVIPLLVGGAAHLTSDRLAPELAELVAPLAAIDAVEFDGKAAYWSWQFDRLVQLLADVPGVPAPRFRMPADHEAPCNLGEQVPVQVFIDPNSALDTVRRGLAVDATPGQVTRYALCGMGGVGKTQLALRYALDHRKDYPGGIWWFNAAGDGVLRAAAMQACAACRIPVAEDDDVCALWRSWIERCREPWLLVFDNAEDAQGIRPCVPAVGPHNVLVTSRSPQWAEAVHLKPWDERNGAQFLKMRLQDYPFKTPVTALRSLVAILGGLPLALEHVAAYLQATHRPLADCIGALDDVERAASLLEHRGVRPATRYTTPVLQTLMLAMPRLSAAAACTLHTLAWCTDQPVPERWLRAPLPHRPAEIQAALDDEVAWNDIVLELRRYALAQRVPIARLERRLIDRPDPRQEPCLRLNRLTQQALIAYAPAVDAGHAQVALAMLAAAAQAEFARPERTGEYVMLVPHLMFRGTVDDDIAAARLLRLLAQLQHAKGDFWAAHGTLADWHRRCESLLGADDAETVEAALLFGESVLDVDRAADALSWAQHVIQHTAEQAPRLDLLHLRAWCLAARCHAALGEPVIVCRIFDEQLGEDIVSLAETERAPWVVDALRTLARALRLAGQTKRALHLQQLVLQWSELLLGSFDPVTMACAGELAASFAELGEPVIARDLQRKLVNLCMQHLGLHHPDTIAALLSLGDSQRVTEQWAEARQTIDLALGAANLTLPFDHPILLALNRRQQELQQALHEPDATESAANQPGD